MSLKMFFRTCWSNMRELLAKAFFTLLIASLSNVNYLYASEQKGEGSMLHMWASRSESEALSVLSKRVEQQGIQWLDYAVSGNMAGVEEELMERIKNGTQPTMVQWIIDDKMRSLVSRGIFKLIEDKHGYFAKHLHPSVAEIVIKDHKLTGLPLNLHIQNHIVYNNNVLVSHGLEVPTTWDELISYGPILEKSGTHILAVSDQPWQLRKLYLSILSSYLTPSEFDEIQVNYTNLGHIEHKLHKAMEVLSALKQYSNLNYNNMKWNDVSKIVSEDKALAQVLGDYIIPEFPLSSNLTCALPPGHQFIYWGSDSIALIDTDNSAETAAQQFMVDLVSNPAVMAEFVFKKGGIPVTSNIQQSQISPCMRNIVVEWNKSNNNIWVGGDAWRNQFVAIGEFLRDEWNKPVFDVDSAADRLMAMLKVL